MNQAPPVALLVGFDVAVARAVHLLIDRPIEMYQHRLTLPDTYQSSTAATTPPQRSGTSSQSDKPRNEGVGVDGKDQDKDAGDVAAAVTTVTGSETSLSLSPLAVGSANEKQATPGVGAGGVGEVADANATAAMKRRVLWDDCLGFLAHVALPGKRFIFIPTTVPHTHILTSLQH